MSTSVMRTLFGRCAMISAAAAYRSWLSCMRSPATPVLEAAAMKPGLVGEGMVSTW
jgi:hypothetical protein